MAYHLLTYSLIFLPVVIALYQLCPARFRFVVLLAADYTFFCMISGKLLVWLLLATLVTYGTGRWLAAIPVRHSDLHGKALTRKKRGVLALGIVLILGALVTLKYLRVFGVTLAAPIGISYYSLQAISYMTDVYRGTQESCKNPIKVALYLSFFPQIMEGPISRFSETADALYGGNSIQFENLVFGYQRIIWGLFKKMVIADRLAPLVAKVFSNYNNFDGAAILVGVLAYTMQLYMEFSGCMDIIMGSGEIFGVPLPENFRQPFFAKNAGDFWRRWHISLGAWMRDYVFYPFALTSPMQKFGKWAKKHLNVHFGRVLPASIANILVFFLVGIWHGSQWHFIFWGLYNGIVIAVSDICAPLFAKITERLHINVKSKAFYLFRIIRTFIIVNIGWYFDRIYDIRDCFLCMKNTIFNFQMSQLDEFLGPILKIMPTKAYVIVTVALCIVFADSVIKERGKDAITLLDNRPLVLRWLLYFGMIFMILESFNFAVDAGGFMYANY